MIEPTRRHRPGLKRRTRKRRPSLLLLLLRLIALHWVNSALKAIRKDDALRVRKGSKNKKMVPWAMHAPTTQNSKRKYVPSSSIQMYPCVYEECTVRTLHNFHCTWCALDALGPDRKSKIVKKKRVGNEKKKSILREPSPKNSALLPVGVVWLCPFKTKSFCLIIIITSASGREITNNRTTRAKLNNPWMKLTIMWLHLTIEIEITDGVHARTSWGCCTEWMSRCFSYDN